MKLYEGESVTPVRSIARYLRCTLAAIWDYKPGITAGLDMNVYFIGDSYFVLGFSATKMAKMMMITDENYIIVW